MSPEEAAETAELFVRGFIDAMDKSAAEAERIYAGSPRTAAGTIIDPYDRGAYDAIQTITSGLRGVFVELAHAHGMDVQ